VSKTTESRAGNIDEFFEFMKQADLEGAPKMGVIDYAKMRGLYPQKVYAAIRNHKLGTGFCSECGRKVVEVEVADEYFKLGKWTPGANVTTAEEEEVPGSDVDAGDEERGQA
jgi:hypothetical protein